MMWREEDDDAMAMVLMVLAHHMNSSTAQRGRWHWSARWLMSCLMEVSSSLDERVPSRWMLDGFSERSIRYSEAKRSTAVIAKRERTRERERERERPLADDRSISAHE